MIAAISHLSRLAHAGFVFAREGVIGLVDPAPLPLPAQTAIKLARLIERPTSTMTCTGGMVRPLSATEDACLCPGNTRRIESGPRAFSCVRKSGR